MCTKKEFAKVPYLNIWSDAIGNLYDENNNKIKYFLNSKQKNYYSCCHSWKWFYVHRLIYFAWHSDVKVPVFYKSVDHINKESFDNRQENLRLLSNSLQNLNRNFKGYTKTGTNKFSVRLMYDGVSYNLGYFRSATKATWIYNSVKKRLFNKIYSEEMKSLQKFHVSLTLIKHILNEEKTKFKEKDNKCGANI